jgi:hypothetical protein
MSKVDVIINDCDSCVLRTLNSSNEGGVTICAIEKSADTFRCTFGLVPEGCPLIKNDIVVRLRSGTGVFSKPQESKDEV